MKAFLINGKLDGGLVDLPDPILGTDEVRIKVSYVGICGSDLHYYFEGTNGTFRVSEPLIPGHELSGIVDLDPSGQFETGTRVTLHPATFGEIQVGIEDKPHLWPGGKYLGSASTIPHTQGAMSEYFIARRSMIRVLPQNLDLRTAALAEPLGVAIHAINVGGSIAGKNILVSGSGPIGLLIIAAAKIMGAAYVTATDVASPALVRAASVGATQIIQIGENEVPHDSFDIVFECSAAPAAVSSALQSVRRAGVIVQVGTLGQGAQSIEIAPIVSKEVEFRGSFRFIDEIVNAIEMLEANSWIASIITHEYLAADAVEAFTLAKNPELSGKVLIKFS